MERMPQREFGESMEAKKKKTELLDTLSRVFRALGDKLPVKKEGKLGMHPALKSELKFESPTSKYTIEQTAADTRGLMVAVEPLFALHAELATGNAGEGSRVLDMVLDSRNALKILEGDKDLGLTAEAGNLLARAQEDLKVYIAQLGIPSLTKPAVSAGDISKRRGMGM